MRVVLEETTLGHLGDVPTGMASMGVGPYVKADGSEVQGMSCVLAPLGESNVIVGLGSVVDVQGTAWEVVAIEKVRGEPGFVTLESSMGEGKEELGEAIQLDYRYSTDCPSCGEMAAWDGSFGEQLGEPVFSMHCESCGNEFGWYDGALASTLKNSPPSFQPGAGASGKAES